MIAAGILPTCGGESLTGEGAESTEDGLRAVFSFERWLLS
jgi:hypothetical protein